MRDVLRSILRWEWAILLLLLPLFMFPSGPRGLALLIIPTFWILRKIIIGHFIPTTPYNIALLVLLGMVGVSGVVTFNFALSLPKIGGLLVGIALYFASVEFSRDRNLWPILAVLIAFGVLAALAGLIGTIWLPPFEFLNNIRKLIPFASLDIPGAVGGVFNLNELAGVLCWVAPLTLACAFGMRHRLWRRNKPLFLLLTASALLTAFILVATSSRGGILAYLISAALVISFFLSRRWRAVLLVGLVIVLPVLISYSANIAGKDIVGDTLGLSGRLEIWSRALLGIADYPITGLGINGFRRVVHVLYPLFAISSDIDLGHAHNHLLQVALDLGLPGLIAYLSLWLISAALLWATWRALRRRNAHHHPYSAIVAGLAGSLMAGWIFGIFDAIALGSRPGFLWWMLLGLTASVHYAVVYSGQPLRPRQQPAGVPQTDEYETAAVQGKRPGALTTR